VGDKGSRTKSTGFTWGGAHQEGATTLANPPILVRLTRADDLGRTIGEKRTNGNGLEVSWVVGLVRTGEGSVELSATSMLK
jgi:hypothetical protein